MRTKLEIVSWKSHIFLLYVMPFKGKANKKELVTSKYRIQNLNKKGFVLVFKVIKHIIIISSITVDLNVSH